MEHRYQPIRVQIPFCIRDHDHTPMCQAEKTWEVDAIECKGTGLAIQKALWHPLWWEDYALVHIASGTLPLELTVPTLVQAGIWLRTVKGVCDWTQPAHLLKRHPETKERVYQAWVETIHHYHVVVCGGKLVRPDQERTPHGTYDD